ncbi:MAG TPA: tetratricopeptide repeat protein [Ktedonobacterales bacterium]
MSFDQTPNDPMAASSLWQFPLEKPVPLWFTAAVPFALAAVLGIAFLLQEGVFGGDWSSGALAVGIAAILMAVGTLAVWGVRFVRGRRVFQTAALALALAVVLAAGGATALAYVAPLHGAQAHALEGQHQWAAAITEYALAGQSNPNSADIARVYDEWGEALLAQGSYSQAVDRFHIVIKYYDQSGAPVARAQKDLVQTYGAWVKAGGNGLSLDDAIAVLSGYRKSDACDKQCQSETLLLEAQARYQFGTQLASAGDYQDAVSQFELVQSSSASSPFAAQARTAAAQALLAWGKALLKSSCGDALPIYKKLAAKYGTTAEGKEAAKALAAPVTVTGTMTNLPGNGTPGIYLSTQVSRGVNYYSNDFAATLNRSTGVFTFSKVPQGNYYFDTALNLGTTQEFNLYTVSNGQPYVVVVGPLCTLNLGKIPYA